MKTTRTLIIAALGVLFLAPALLADVEIGAQLRITPRPRQDLEVYVWPDRGMDGVYYPGEIINVNVEVTRDAFLILYNVDTRGRLHILFPSSPWDDNLVQAGDAISFPRPWDDVDWTIDGPAGTEYIQVIASEIPISPPEWPVYINDAGISGDYYAPSELRDFQAGGDRYAYIDVVNRNICGRYYDWAATDVATFQVRNHPPVYHTSYIDPWPDVFYGQIYIGWPIGSRIYIDGIFIGVAPCYIPRHYYGRRIITCYDGPRLIRRHEVNVFPKRDYYSHDRYRGIRDYVYKKARPDVYDHFQIEKSGTGKKKYRVVERQKIGVYNNGDDYNRVQSTAKQAQPKKQDDGYVIKREGGKSASSAPARIENQRKSSKSDPGFVIKRDKSQSRDKANTEQSAPKARTADMDRERANVILKSPPRKETMLLKGESERSRESVSVTKQTARSDGAQTQIGKSAIKSNANEPAGKHQKIEKSAASKRSKGRD